jgi:hypothetical protein
MGLLQAGGPIPTARSNGLRYRGSVDAIVCFITKDCNQPPPPPGVRHLQEAQKYGKAGKGKEPRKGGVGQGAEKRDGARKAVQRRGGEEATHSYGGAS